MDPTINNPGWNLRSYIFQIIRRVLFLDSEERGFSGCQLQHCLAPLKNKLSNSQKSGSATMRVKQPTPEKTLMCNVPEFASTTIENQVKITKIFMQACILALQSKRHLRLKMIDQKI